MSMQRSFLYQENNIFRKRCPCHEIKNDKNWGNNFRKALKKNQALLHRNGLRKRKAIYQSKQNKKSKKILSEAAVQAQTKLKSLRGLCLIIDFFINSSLVPLPITYV